MSRLHKIVTVVSIALGVIGAGLILTNFVFSFDFVRLFFGVTFVAAGIVAYISGKSKLG